MTKEIRDQAAHAAAAAAIVLLANLLGADIGPLPGLLIGWSGGLIREITEEGEVSLAAAKKAVRGEFYLSFWALGGAVAGLVA